MSFRWQTPGYDNNNSIYPDGKHQAIVNNNSIYSGGQPEANDLARLYIQVAKNRLTNLPEYIGDLKALILESRLHTAFIW
jgi:hypothetical protein